MYSYDASNPNIDSASIISNAITDVLILSTKAGSVGLTLTAASRVIILDSSFNPVDDRQAIGRVYRYGQRKPVYAYRLICEDTMEHRLLYQKIAKEWLFRSVVDRNEVKRNEFLEIHLVDIVEKLWAKHRRKSVTDVFNVDDEVDQYGVSIPTTKTNPSFSYNTSEGNSHMNDRLSSVCFLQDPKVLRVLANLFIHVSQHECFFEPDDEESELMFYENYCRTELLDSANGSLENGNDITEKEMKRKEVTKVSDKTDVAKETQVSPSIIGGGGWEVRDNRSKHDSKEQEGQNRVGLSVRGETVGTNETQIAEKKMRRLMRGKISLSSVIDQLLRERREKINQKIMPDKQKDLILLDDNPNLSLSHSASEQGVLLPSNTSVGADVANTVTPRVVNSQQSARYLRMAFGNRCGALFQNGKWNIESYDTYAQLPFKSASDGTVTIIDSDDEE